MFLRHHCLHMTAIPKSLHDEKVPSSCQVHILAKITEENIREEKGTLPALKSFLRNSPSNFHLYFFGPSSLQGSLGNIVCNVREWENDFWVGNWQFVPNDNTYSIYGVVVRTS